MRQSAHQRRMALRQGRPSATPETRAVDPPAPARWRTGLFSLLRHPLFLLLASSLLVSGVGRLYNDHAERLRDRAERREQLAPLLVELRYRTLLISREAEPMAEHARQFLRKYDKPEDAEELAKAYDFFAAEEVDAEIERDLNELEEQYARIQPGVLAVIRGEVGTSDPQFAKVHLAVISYRIELLSGLPVQRFEAPPKGAPPEVRRPDVGIMSALMNLEQNLVFDSDAFIRALSVLAVYTDLRERNYAADLLPIEQGEPAPAETDYLRLIDGDSGD
jgi:hypothetical protein